MKPLVLSIFSFLMFSSCGVLITDRKEVEKLPDDEQFQTIYVNSYKKACVGVGPMSCLQIQRKDVLDHDAWEFFYDEIEGFEFEPGYIYKLKIKTENLKLENIPADASSIKYTYIETIEKWLDPRMTLHDIWALTAIDKIQIPSDSFPLSKEQPILELNITEMKIYGNDGCNEIEGNIITVDENRLELSEISSSRMSCPNMESTSIYKNTLQKIRRYDVENLELILYDNKNQEILRFKKVD